MRLLSTLLLLTLSACASLSDRAREQLHAPGLEGTRWGLIVTTLDGRELVSINPDERFLPASNTKLFTVAAAFHTLGDMTQADPARGTSLRLIAAEGAPPTLFLVGAGDPTLIDAPDCQRNCLSDLVEAVAALGITEVGGIVVDTSLFPYELWPPGWSHEDRVTRSGAPVSAITINSNELLLVVAPGATTGGPAIASFRDDFGALVIGNDVVTVAQETSPDDILVERYNDSPLVRVFGRIGVTSHSIERPVAIDEPALLAGQRLGARLSERGITVGGGIHQILRNRVAHDAAPEARSAPEGVEIARLVPAPLIDNVTFLNKQSQNLHAELLLRRVGLARGDGSREAGLAAIETMLADIAIPRWSWDLFDGSGMSVYNRVTPRTVATLLRWTTQQPWSDAFRATLPIGGVDGTLRRRFAGTSLEGRIFAKTGTLMGTTALSGFLTTKSGQTLIFSAYANERPATAGSASAALDATLVTISETN